MVLETIKELWSALYEMLNLTDNYRRDGFLGVIFSLVVWMVVFLFSYLMKELTEPIWKHALYEVKYSQRYVEDVEVSNK